MTRRRETNWWNFAKRCQASQKKEKKKSRRESAPLNSTIKTRVTRIQNSTSSIRLESPIKIYLANLLDSRQNHGIAHRKQNPKLRWSTKPRVGGEGRAGGGGGRAERRVEEQRELRRRNTRRYSVQGRVHPGERIGRVKYRGSKTNRITEAKPWYEEGVSG